MSLSLVTQEPSGPGPNPVAGPQFRAAAQAAPSGNKRRKLFCLLAAYQDAGYVPTVDELAGRLGLDVRKVSGLLRRLEDDGVLVIEWASKAERESGQRHRYELNLDAGSGR
jgi:DNA-binding transcriptional ArsR family regulator